MILMIPAAFFFFPHLMWLNPLRFLPSLSREVLSCSCFISPNYWGDRLNSLLKSLKFTFSSSLGCLLMIREEAVVGHISLCKSSSRQWEDNRMCCVGRVAMAMIPTGEGTCLAEDLASSPCLRAVIGINSYCMKSSPEISIWSPAGP